MFEHLNDPRPDGAITGWRDGVARRVRRRRRRRAGMAAGGLAVVALLAVIGAMAADQRLQPQRVEVAGVVDEPPVPGEPTTFLFVGVDHSAALAQDPARAERRTDTIVLGRLDPASSELRLLVVPRDLWVPIAETDGEQRINAAFATGGPGRLIETISNELGIAVDRYIEADFDGARGIVDALGGLRLSVPHAVASAPSGLSLGAGCQVLDGDQVLALGRARKGVVIADPDASGGRRLDESGDFGRQARAAVIAAALVRAVGEVEPTDLPRLLHEGLNRVVVDAETSRDDLLALGRQAATVAVVPHHLPSYEDTVGQLHVLRLAPGAAEVITTFLDGGDPPAPGPGVGPGGPPLISDQGDQTGLAVC